MYDTTPTRTKQTSIADIFSSSREFRPIFNSNNRPLRLPPLLLPPLEVVAMLRTTEV